jgi:alpha-methylacyl-CoA racemase
MGPLEGVKAIELAGIGPGPFCAMLLADLGADVIRIDRADKVQDPVPDGPYFEVMNRGRRSVGVDLKSPEGVETVLSLVESADLLLEGFRPGVTERLGLGPDDCLARNPKLVYGRMTGWGQDGPWAQMAGHDINYIALAGALGHFGRKDEAPVPPLNLVGDFGGGAMFLAFGLLAGLVNARSTGQGQVVDAAMVDGTAVLMTMFHSFAAMGFWNEERGTNLLDTGTPFYDVYETADGLYVSVGSLEPQFFAVLVEKTGLTGPDGGPPAQNDKSAWPHMRAELTRIFKEKTRAEWDEVFTGSDACYAPVLTMSEARAQDHNVQRETFIDVAGTPQPAPAPRFSRTPNEVVRPPAWPGQHTDEVLGEWGFAADRITALRESGAVR